ncbi:MAG: hypothetical protein PVF68_06030 [Acidobacteriota bacterium]|jgi:hypothetical protein
MSAWIRTESVDVLTFLGLLTGVCLLVTAYFLVDWRLLAVPGLALLMPSLIYGLR